MIRIFALVLFILIPLTASSTPGKQALDTGKKIKIGVSTALSGGGATYGMDLRDALLFAVEKLGGDRYELIFEDDKCDGKTAVSVANKFVHVDKVDYVFGYACSSAALAALPILERAKIPVMITCASSPKIADAGDFVFRTFPSDLFAAKRLHDHLLKKHKLVAMISEETDYSQDLKEAFLHASNKSDLEVIEENYLPNTPDFKPILLKLKSKKPEGIFVNAQTEASSATIVDQMKELKWNVPVYNAYWGGSPAFLELAKQNAEGIEFADTPSLDQLLNEDGKKVFEEFQAKYPKPRSIEAIFATTFEGFRALDSAIQSGEDLRAFLYKQDFEGIVGKYSFDSKGEIEGLSFMMKKIVNGQPVPLG